MGYGEFASAAGRWRSHDAPHSPTRDGAGCTLKQHLWGARYVDDLVQIAVNDDPPSQPPLRRAGPRDGNPHASGLVARYDCTPGVHPPRRGQRTVYKKAGIDDELTTAPLVHSQRVVADGDTKPYGLCDVGHQGLMHDEQFGLVYNRNRYLHQIGRWEKPDPAVLSSGLGAATTRYRQTARAQDGMNRYEYARSSPLSRRDPSGLTSLPSYAQDWQTISYCIGTMSVWSVPRQICCAYVLKLSKASWPGTNVWDKYQSLYGTYPPVD